MCGLEMLSLSVGRAHCDDTQVQFDDRQWQRHTPSLRPLGLAVQLLLSDPVVADRVLRLSDHLTHAALLRTHPPCQPVRPPWGLHELPRILGESRSSGSAVILSWGLPAQHSVSVSNFKPSEHLTPRNSRHSVTVNTGVTQHRGAKWPKTCKYHIHNKSANGDKIN